MNTVEMRNFPLYSKDKLRTRIWESETATEVLTAENIIRISLVTLGALSSAVHTDCSPVRIPKPTCADTSQSTCRNFLLDDKSVLPLSCSCANQFTPYELFVTSCQSVSLLRAASLKQCQVPTSLTIGSVNGTTLTPGDILRMFFQYFYTCMHYFSSTSAVKILLDFLCNFHLFFI
jgi:hypothetical protein